MAKQGSHGLNDNTSNKKSYYDDNSQIEKRLSEIDKLIREENIDRESLFDNFSSEKSDDNKSTIKPQRTSRQAHRTPETTDKKSSSKTRGSTHNNSAKEFTNKKSPSQSYSKIKDTKKDSAKNNRQYNDDKDKNKRAKNIIIAVVAAVVLISCAMGTYIYISGISGQNGAGSSFLSEKSTENNSKTTNPHETLAVITVSDKSISFNGEELSSTDELENKLQQNDDLTLSLINIDADPAVYNAVARLLNNYGGSYELMDSENTNPSINTYNSESTAIEENT